ncbi:hypothetical protein F5884DRAFT_806115 [Xylogone sp. PMI_703]|nr:hypothetical protein F5884DRAFT_806115 [Xylogone sp. PMI_703]
MDRFQILLSIHYHCTVLFMNGAVIDAFLRDLSRNNQSAAASSLLLESLVPGLKDDLSAARSLQSIIEQVMNRDESFIVRNGVWWICNYSSFTISLHLFGILMACRIQESALQRYEINISEVRSLLLKSLNTLEIVGKKSLMSCKARQCLIGFLEVFDSVAPQVQEPIEHADSEMIGELVTSTMSPGLAQIIDADSSDNYFADYITQSADDFLFLYSQNAYLDGDIAVLDNINV